MRRDVFEDLMKTNFESIDEVERHKILEKSLETDGTWLKTVVIIEELAELQKEVAKMKRFGKVSTLGLVEEIADVLISLEFLKKMYGIDPEILDKAVRIKLSRDKFRCDNVGHYTNGGKNEGL